MKKDKTTMTFLGQDSVWDGELTFNGSIRIDGHFKGHILSGGTLIIGEEGLVEANIHVSYATINGEVYGDIIADQRVDIHSPGKVFGNIQAPSVVIDEGVIFEGTTRMYQAKESNDKESVLIDSDKYTGGPPPNLTAIHGIVTDLNSGKPIKHAIVKCKGNDEQSTNTNALGYYELINLKDGKWKLIIKAKGYKKEKEEIEIFDGGNYKKNVALKSKDKR